MKSALVALFAVTVAAVCLSFAREAHAGEGNALGCIFVADAGVESNVTTGYNLNNLNIQQFNLPPQALITIQCMRGPCMVATNVASTDAGRALWLAANEKITSSLGVSLPKVRRADGGSYTGGVVAVTQGAGASVAEVCIWERRGNE